MCQDDVVIPNLTVRQSLTFTARLRLGKEATTAEWVSLNYFFFDYKMISCNSVLCLRLLSYHICFTVFSWRHHASRQDQRVEETITQLRLNKCAGMTIMKLSHNVQLLFFVIDTIIGSPMARGTILSIYFVVHLDDNIKAWVEANGNVLP